MNRRSNVTASTLAMSTATMAPIAMKTVRRLAKRRPDSLFAVIFVQKTATMVSEQSGEK